MKNEDSLKYEMVSPPLEVNTLTNMYPVPIKQAKGRNQKRKEKNGIFHKAGWVGH